LDVAEHNSGRLFVHFLERGVRGFGLPDLVSGCLNPTRQYLPHAMFVVDNQDQ